MIKEFFTTYNASNDTIAKETNVYEENKIVRNYLSKIEYVYDEMNNWIRRISYGENEELSFVMTRQIVYY